MLKLSLVFLHAVLCDPDNLVYTAKNTWFFLCCSYGCHTAVSVHQKTIGWKCFPSAQCQQGLDFKISPWQVSPPAHENKGWTD